DVDSTGGRARAARSPSRLSNDQKPRSDRRIHDRRRTDRVAARRGHRAGRAGAGRRETGTAMNIRSITAPNPGPFTLDGTRTYLLDDAAVLDPGPAMESHIEAIRAAMPALRTIFITHRHGDHAPAAVPLQRATGARIVAPRGV